MSFLNYGELYLPLWCPTVQVIVVKPLNLYCISLILISIVGLDTQTHISAFSSAFLNILCFSHTINKTLIDRLKLVSVVDGFYADSVE